MSLKLEIGDRALLNYKRLSYQPWYALAELVDNATQSYFNFRTLLDEAYKKEGGKLQVIVDYDKDNDLIRVFDTAMGMSYGELQDALVVSKKPQNPNSRSRYGMGLKTSACWLGDRWSIRTKKLGSPDGYLVEIDLTQIEQGKNPLTESKFTDKPEKHYTIVEVRSLHRIFHGQTTKKIEQFLRSIYRADLKNKIMDLSWRNTMLTWEDEPHDAFVKAPDGSYFRKDLNFTIGAKTVTGWVGVLNDGGRSKAGFALLYYNRVIDPSWRPALVFGDARNDLINQRLVGELHLNDFDVSHQKDAIAWVGNEDEEMESELKMECTDYVAEARKTKKGRVPPNAIETTVALQEIRKEMESQAFVDKLTIETFPEPAAVNKAFEDVISRSMSGPASLIAKIQLNGGRVLTIKVFLDEKLSPNDPYVAMESARQDEVIITINQCHPHWPELSGSESIHMFIKHCIYDGIAEWQAHRLNAPLSPNTIKLLKDDLLRVRFEVENAFDSGDDTTGGDPK